ncbi:MAG: hypothetical protein IJW82_05080, partial [Clostridia bacterium]|nr:hypothetical protein [Clostridia bacterium]
YEKESKKAILALDFDEDMGRRFVLAYSMKNGVYTELPIEFNNQGKLLVYCNMDENIIIIEGSQLVVISIWILIAFIMVCVFAYLLIYSYMYKKLIGFIEIDISTNDKYIDYSYLIKENDEILTENQIQESELLEKEIQDNELKENQIQVQDDENEETQVEDNCNTENLESQSQESMDENKEDIVKNDMLKAIPKEDD